MAGRLAAALAAALVLAGWGLAVPAGAAYDPQAEFEGLPEGPGREEVYYTCIACHSTAIIQQQRLPRRTWDDVLHWMVDEMGMVEPSEEDWEVLLDYLSEHFGQDSPR